MRVRKSTSISGRVGAKNSDLATRKIRSLMISIYFWNIYKLIIIKWSIYSLNYIKNYVFSEKFLRVGRSATFPGRVGSAPTRPAFRVEISYPATRKNPILCLGPRLQGVTYLGRSEKCRNYYFFVCSYDTQNSDQQFLK